MPRQGKLIFALAVSVGAAGLIGCAALRDDLTRAQRAYDQARYEEALVWLDALEEDTPDMEPPMRARFYYLRGMAAYRLDERDDALHYLALAREVAGRSRARLVPDQRESMERTLAELTPKEASHRARAPAEP